MFKGAEGRDSRGPPGRKLDETPDSLQGSNCLEMWSVDVFFCYSEVGSPEEETITYPLAQIRRVVSVKSQPLVQALTSAAFLPFALA